MYIIINNKPIKLMYANSFSNRLKGLMFKKNFNYGIFFPKCKSIHTFFIKENIDIIITNKDNRIIYLEKNIQKNKIIYKKEAYNIIELPINSINKLQIDDYIEIEN